MSANLCSNCGAGNTGRARFCASCGKRLMAAQPPSTPANCPQCQVPLRPNARFCPACGFNLANPPPGPGKADPKTQYIADPSGTPALVVRWPGGNQQRHALSGQRILVGRLSVSDVQINSPMVSNRHFQLDIHTSGMTITDLNSTNGTQINGHRIPPNVPHPLKSGDVVRVGDLTGNSVSMIIETGTGESLRTLALGKLDMSKQTSMVIGRNPSCYLPLNHPTVSQRHAMIFKQNGGLAIRDLTSTNGTFVNGTRIKQVPLSSGDVVQIGPFKLVYDAQKQSLAQSMRLGHRLDAIQLGREVSGGKMILDKISLSIQSSEFVALVGGSGAGKSTLLKALNGYDQANHGHMLLDGEPLYPNLDMYRTQMGYVPQDDIIHRELPVKLALWYAAKLRLPDATPAEIEARIQDALKSVDMVEHASKRVHVLSGGQRKRVSIAVEMLARPTLFFLDEPTSGLDPGLEKKMMYDMNHLADEGRTVVMVTHATANIEQCDYVAFLSYGRLAYYGPPKDALTFYNVTDFADIYLQLSQEIDPARGKPAVPVLQPYYQQYQAWAAKQARQKGKPASTKVISGVLWAEHFRRSPFYKKYITDRQQNLGADRQVGPVPAAAPVRRGRDSTIRQTWLLARRQFDLIRMDVRTLFILLLMTPMIGLLFMMVSGKQDLTGWQMTEAQVDSTLTQQLVDAGLDEEVGEKEDYIPTATAETLVTMIGLALTQSGTFAAAYEIVKERAIFKRERAINLRVPAYVLSKVLVLSAFAVIQVASVLFILGLKMDFDFDGAIIKSGLMELYLTLFLSVIASIMFGLFLSAIVPSTDVVLYAILVQLFVQIILSGTMFPMESNIASKATIGHWTMNAMGSTIDLEKLNQESRVCSVVEIPSMTGGEATTEVKCGSAVRDLGLEYEHTEEHVRGTWVGLMGNALVWGVLTVVVQARKKSE